MDLPQVPYLIQMKSLEHNVQHLVEHTPLDVTKVLIFSNRCNSKMKLKTSSMSHVLLWCYDKFNPLHTHSSANIEQSLPNNFRTQTLLSRI